MIVKKPAPPKDTLMRTIVRCGTKKAAAEYYGVGICVLIRWCKERGINKNDVPNPYSKGKKPSDDELRALVEKYRRIPPIAKHLGTSFSAIKGWCDDIGLKPEVGSRYDKEDIPIILELAETLTHAEIGEKWEVSAWTVGRWLSKWRAA